MLLEIRIRTLLIFCMMFVLRPAVLMAEEPGNSQNQLVLKEGLNYFYNSDFKSADKKFEEYIALEPEDPVGYWRMAYNLFFEAKTKQSTDTPILTQKEYDKLVALTNQGLGKADVRIRRNDQVDFHLYVKACLHTIKAGAEAKNVSWWPDAAGSMKTALGLAEQSQYQDTKFLVGMANYIGGGKNVAIRALLSLYGLPHDRKLGRNLILAAAEQNAKLEAGYHITNLFADDVYLGVFNILIDKKNNYSQAEIKLYSDYLSSKYPRNEMVKKYLEGLQDVKN